MAQLAQYLVVDGYALCYRAWHGYPKLTNDVGKSTQVVTGFFKMLLSRVPDLDDRKIIFCFDSPGGSFRNELDPTYKANRTKAEDSFYEQVDEVVQLCRMIAPTFRIDGYEADDLAGSFVQQYVKPEDDCVLLTVDGDWLQLLRPGVRVLQLKTQGSPVTWTRELFFEKYSGLVPEQLIDMKALMGDGSDNIPGIKGVGWVATLNLLTQYRTIEDIYENILKVTNKGNLQTKLIAHEERVRLNKTLATIFCDVPLNYQPSNAWNSDLFLDYLHNELQADSLMNLFGVYLQKRPPYVEGE